MAFGLFVSAFARTEFQAVQFMPAFVLPQILLCGLFVAREQMADWLQSVSTLLPLTYAFDALDRAAHDPTLGARFWLDVAVARVRALAPCSAPPRCAAHATCAAADGRLAGTDPRRYVALTAAISLTTESFASPNSIVVCGSRKSSLSMPAKPGAIERFITTIAAPCRRRGSASRRSGSTGRCARRG